MEKYRLTKLLIEDTIPFDLLLLADETVAAIEKYIYQSSVYTLFIKDNLSPIAAFALYQIDHRTVEIKNIAVLETFQNTGIGSFLILEIKEIARNEGYTTIIVGTADTGTEQIRFYEKNGFEKYAVKENFFIDNYSTPIIENGVTLKDMVMLKTNC